MTTVVQPVTDFGGLPPIQDMPVEESVRVDDASSITADENVLFYRLFPNADDEKSDESSGSETDDGTLPSCLHDGSSDASSTIADSDMSRLFGGSDSDASSADSFQDGFEDNVLDIV